MTNFPLPTNITGFVSLLQYAQIVTENLAGDIILLGIGFFLFLQLKKIDDMPTTLLVFGILISLFGLLFWMMNFLSVFAFFISLALGFLGIVVKIAYTIN
jgi:hypothetical protein